MTALSGDAASDLERENTRLRAELRAAREHQAASAEILRAIGTVSGDAEQSLRQITSSTRRLFEASSVTIFVANGDEWGQIIHDGASSQRIGAEVPVAQLRIGGHSLPGAVFAENRQMHLPDIDNVDPAIADWPGLRPARAAGSRTISGTPLRRAGQAIGVLIVHRDRLAPFTDEELASLQNFADQAAIAIENARLFNQTSDALDRQNATADILRTIASAPGDAARSLQQIAETSARLFGAPSASIQLAENGQWGEAYRFGTSAQHIRSVVPLARITVDGQNLPGQVITRNEQIHIPDLDHVDPSMADWPGLPLARAAGTRTMCGTPLRREGKAIGALIVYRDKLLPFTPEELALQQSFADQGVIAIENARLFNETREALERQTATADILKVIASSPSDVQPVFDAIATSANRLVGGFSTAVHRVIDDIVTLEAFTPTNPESDQALKAAFPQHRSEVPAVALVENGETAQIPDAETADAQTQRLGRARGWRSVTMTPLMNQGTFIGFIACTRREPGVLADHHVQLLRTFADQAVIAVENTRLFNETREALERQTATADVLKVIANSPSDVQPVFDAIATSAKRLLGGFSTAVFRFVEGKVHLAAYTPTHPAADEALRADFPQPVENFEAFRFAEHGKPFPIPDTEAVSHAPVRDIARLHGFRSMLWVPMINSGVPIGIISVTRAEPGAFAVHHVQLLQTFADQAVIAIENARLFNETREALERQTATADILKVIASSPSDVQPVFDAIATSSKRLIGGFSTAVFRFVDGIAHLAAFTPTSAEADEVLKAGFPSPVDNFEPFKLAQGGKPIQIPDIEALPGSQIKEIARARGFRGMLFAPLMSNGLPIGLISVTRLEPGSFIDHHVQLLQTFADQAVIAIENVRLFNEVQARTRDLTEALTYQTGSANILKVIASSPTDVEPVLAAIVESACELCGADDAVVHLRDGDDLRYGAHHGPLPVGFDRHPISRDIVSGRSLLDGTPVHLRDVLSDEGAEFPQGQRISRQIGVRTILSVPMLREGQGVGAIVLRRTAVEPFSDKQVTLLQTFADQAVIALGNVRLFDEVQAKTRDLSEALTYQTGSANILKVIASSPTDVEPALKAIVESACELCEAYDAAVVLKDGDFLRFSAHHGPIPIGLEKWPINRRWTAGRAFIDQTPVHIEDLRDEKHADFSDGRELSIRMGHRSILSVPLLREKESIGAIVLRRKEVHAFTDKQITLLQTFADQAVIAIGNVRLFEEVQAKTRDLTEALQQQTATADVLKVISRSAFDLQIVLDALLTSACRLCEADIGTVRYEDGGSYKLAATHGCKPEWIDHFRTYTSNADRSSIFGRTILEGHPVHVPDVLADPDYSRPQAQKLMGFRAALGVPLVREGHAFGVINLFRFAAGSFEEKQIELVTTFADQAVIAIENVRLFEQVQAKTRDLSEALTHQTGSANILKVIASSPTDVEPVLRTIVDSACELCEAHDAVLVLKEGRDLAVRAHHGPIEMGAQTWADDRTSVSGRAIADRAPIHLHDALSDECADFPIAQAMSRRDGCRTILAVPMLSEGESIGAIVLRRAEVQPFGDKQIALLQTFADQAVIAIGNVRLFEEVQAKTRDLTEALQQQTATADVLKVISRSAFDLQTVLETLIRSAVELSNARRGVIFLREGEQYNYQAASYADLHPDWVQFLRENPQKAGRNSAIARAIESGQVVCVPDVLADPEITMPATALAGIRAVLAVPLLRDGKVEGIMALSRQVPGPFTDRQIDLVQTFADQAVIALENVRLFEEVQARTKELAASLDELRAAQDRLVQTEKLASLGQLTAGIAHEIKNPLNFVNNFAALSAELTDELNELLGSTALAENVRDEVDELTGLLKDNLQKVVQHGKRADSIVKNMLLHSREGSGEHRPTDINALVEESLNLAYHGARAEKPQFNVTLRRELDPEAGLVEAFPQEITRVLLNLISNGFYAVAKRGSDNGMGFEPVLSASTRGLSEHVEIRIRDNGTGIPHEVKEKMFNPFFTTKPAGEGTGLGLSMSHDIIVKQHGGTIDVETAPGEFTEFTILLPRKSIFSSKT